jgi:L-fuconolactonase
MIDAHQHFWQLGRHDCAWPTPDLAPIHRDFMPGDLRDLAFDVGVTGTVLVQSQPSDRDTDFLCELAERTDWIKAVVGWADLTSPAAPARISALAGRPRLRGLRPMLQDLPPENLADPALEPAIAAMIEHDLSFDALVRPGHLSQLYRFAERHPSLRIVIDHAAKPNIALGALDPWRTRMEALATLPNVYCKLSGLVTEARADWKAEDLEPVVMSLLAEFGAERLMWGSDWPVVELAADYGRWLNTAQALTRNLSESESAALFRDTAVRFYRLDP